MPPPPKDPRRTTYTGGTPTAGYATPEYAARTPQGVLPEEDFRQSTWMRDWWETKGAANRARYLSRNPDKAPTANNSRAGAGTTQWQRYQLQKAAELDSEFDRRNELVGINHPIVKDLVAQARAAGVQLQPGDVANLARVGELERAKNVLVDRIRRGDNRGVGNVLLTMRQRDPKMAALLSPMVEDAIKELTTEAIQDPNLIEDAISWLGESDYSPVKRGLQGLTFLNEQVRHVGAAATYSPDGGLPVLANAMTMNPGTIAGRAVQNWDATARGAMSEQRLDDLRTQYPPQIVDTAIDITRRLAEGDDSVFAEILSDDTTPPEVALFVRDVLYNGPSMSAYNAGDLMEGIEGARLDNIGDITSTALAKVVAEQTGSEYMYSSSWRGAMSQVSNLVWELGADPINYVGTPIRAVTAARYAITKLAPTGLTGEAARIPIAKALASRSVAGVETNRARRYFEGILDQLDRIDDFTPGSIEASDAWRRVIRQHREIPTDILKQMADIRNIPKVNGKRTMDGAVIETAEGQSRRAGGFIDWIVSQNEQWQSSVGKASEKAQRAGEAYLIEQAIKAKLIDEMEPDDLLALAAGKRPKQSRITTQQVLKTARENLPPEIVANADEIVEGAIRRQGADTPYLAQRFKQYNKRDQVIPYTGVLGDLRRRAVNGIIAERIGATRTQQIIDEFIGEDISPEAVANKVDANFTDGLDMSSADRALTGKGRGQALSDRVSGMLSSMPNGRFINIATGENSEEVYRFARMFYTRKTAAFLADKFLRGDAGTRRLLLAGLIRSAAASRGVNLSAEEVLTRIGDLATGSRGGEMFAIPTPGTPSGDMMKATLDQADVAGRTAKKEAKRVKRTAAEIEKLQAQLDGAVNAGDEAAAKSLTRQMRRMSARQAKQERRATRAAADAERYKKRLITALGRNDVEAPSAFQQRIPAAMAEDIEDNLGALADPGIVAPPVTLADDVVEAGPLTPRPDGPAPLRDATFTTTRDGEPGFVETQSIRAEDAEGNLIGVIVWDVSKGADFVESKGRVLQVYTEEPYRRQGVASDLWDRAQAYANQNDLPAPIHSPTEQSPSGKAWADAVDARGADAPIPESGRITTARLPEDLRGAKPRYRDKNVTFVSDVERALFIVRNEAKRSRRDADYMAFLRRQFPDMDDAAIRERGNAISARIKEAYPDAGETVVIRPDWSGRGAAQTTLADDGSLVDEAIDPTGRPQVDAPGAQTAQQVAFDAEGMTPPPQQMVGAQMQEMSFGDDVVSPAVDAGPGRMPTPGPDDRFTVRKPGATHGVVIKMPNRGKRRVEVDVTYTPGVDYPYHGSLRSINYDYVDGDSIRSFWWKADGEAMTTYGVEDGVDWEKQALADGIRKAVDEYGIPAPESYIPERYDFGNPRPGSPEEIRKAVYSAQTTKGQDPRPIVESPTGRPEMPMDPVNRLDFPDREAGYGYTTTVAAGKGAERNVVVTLEETRHGNPEWKFELDKDRSKEYDLGASIRFDEWGDIHTPVWRPDADKNNVPSKPKSLLLAKAIVAEAKKYDIPIRGDMYDWLEMIGAKPVKETTPAPWKPESIIRDMSHEELDMAAEWILRHEPSLGQRPDDLWGPPVARSNIRGRGTGGQYPSMNWQNPYVRRWLAAYLGDVDGVPKPDLDELRAAAFARTTRSIPGDWKRVGDRKYVTDDGWTIDWRAEGPSEDMPWRSSDGGDYVLTDPDGNVVKRQMPGIGDRIPPYELDWGDIGWAINEANERRGFGEFVSEDRWDQIDDAIASPAPEPVAIEPAAEVLQGLPTFDDFLEAHPRFDEFSQMMESLGQRFDDTLARELGELEDDLSAEWATMVLGDPDVRAAYLDAQGIPDEIPEKWYQHFGDQFDNQTAEKQQMAGMGSVEAGGARVDMVQESLGLGDNFHVHGGVTRGQLVDLMDQYGEEAVWAWWNTGNMEAALSPDFLRDYGVTPKRRPDPGKGLPAARKAAQVPGEYTGAEFTAPPVARRGSSLVKKLEAAKRDLAAAQKSGDEAAISQAEYIVAELARRVDKRKPATPTKLLRVPWKGSVAEREDYIARKYADFQEEAIEEAMQGADRRAIQRYADAVLAERSAVREVQSVIDEIEPEPALVEEQMLVEEPIEVADEVIVPASEDVIEGTVLNRVDEPIPAAAAPPAGGPPSEPPAGGPGMEGAGEPEPARRLPKTGELAQWLAKYQGSGRNLPTQVVDGESFVTPSRDEFGREHAVHVYQTSDYVVIPHLDEIEAFGRIRDTWLGNAAHRGMQTSTDIWSLATLYGFRFAMRSSVEDLMTFTLTGGLGHLADLQRGRRGSTAIREATPDIVVEPEMVGGKPTGEMRVVTPATDSYFGAKRPRTSRLGMVARTSRHLGDKKPVAATSRFLTDLVHRGNRESTRSFWMGNLSQEEIVRAAAEIQSGRYGAMQSLISKAAGRMYLTGLSKSDERALELLGGTHAGRMLLEKMAEAGAQINSGSYRALDDAMQAVADNPDLTAVGFKRPVNFGDFKRLALSANTKADPFADWYWHRNLQAIVRDDGPIGQIFVKLMHDPDRAKKAIADAIRKDTRMGYRERFSLITSDAAVDDFAHRYYEASLPYFQKADGTINEGLRSSFIDSWVDPKSGKSRMRVNWYQTDKQGREFLRVHPKALSRMPREDKPMYVLGREEKVVMPTTDKALMDRAWEWMGNQYARIAREPIFIGNYISNMRALKPMQNQLAQAMANGRAGKTGAKVTDTDVKVAEAITARQSQDAAYAFALNYMDNPGNRSVLAWKVRNVARYYRATEDFARRATRLAKNYPDAYYKLAMTYQVLEDTGFTYRDDNGDMYFAYPANSFLQDAFSAIGGAFGGFGTPVSADPFMVGGFVKNVAPSTDPEQWAPTFTGAVTIPLVGLFNMFPALQGLRAATLGGYSSAGQTGSLVGELADAIMPAGVKRIWSQLEPAERDSAMASAGAAAVASMIADGKFDHVYGNDTPLTLEQLKKDDVYAEAQRRAVGITLTKVLLGYTAPAAPQVFQNNVTQFARESGIESIDTLFQDLIEANDGDIAAAYLDWQRMDPDSKLLPFTVSKTKNNPDRLIGLTGAKPYTEVVEWMREPGTKALAQKFPDAYMWLAPQKGTFDWAAWGILKSSGFRVNKSEDEMLIDMFAGQGENLDRQTVAAYDVEIAKYSRDSDEGRKQIAALEAAKTADREQIKNMNPYWATKSQTRLEPYDVESIRQQFIETQNMLDYLESKGPLTGSAANIRAAMESYLTVNVAKASISPYTDAGKAERSQYDMELSQVYDSISQSDPVAANFIKSILSSQSLFGRLM